MSSEVLVIHGGWGMKSSSKVFVLTIIIDHASLAHLCQELGGGKKSRITLFLNPTFIL